MKPKYHRFAILFIALSAGPLARATDYTFTGTTTGTTTWSSGTDWDAVPLSGSTTDLVFGTGQTLASGAAVVTDQDIASPFELNSLTTNYNYASGSTPIVIQGGALSFVSDGATTPGIALNSIGTAPQINISSAVNFGNDTAIGGASDIMFSGSITNTGAAVVTKSGAGTMRIAANNPTYTGDFNVTGGILQFGNNSSAGDAGSGTVTLSGGGSFVVRRSSGTLTLNNTITGTGNVKFQTRNFTATINKANTYIGTTTLEASSTTSPGGGIKLGIDNGLPFGTAFTINRITNGVPQTFDLNGFNQTLASIATTGSGVATTNSIVTNTGAAKTLTVSNSSGTTTYAGLISGVIALTKSGASTQVLSGANSYSGITTVNAGVLQAANGSALGSTAAGTVVNGSDGSVNLVGTVLDLNGVTVSGESLTLDSGTTSNNRVTLRTVGTTSNIWAGGVSLAGNKTVQLSANTGGQLEISGTITSSSFSGGLTLRGAGTGILSGGVTLSGTTTITVNDLSTWNINSSGNTWGNTNLFNGTLVLGAANALPTTTSVTLGGGANSGTLKLNGRSQTVAGLTTGGTGTANKVVGGSATAGALTVNNSTANVFAGVLGGTGTDENNFSLTKSAAGTLTLSGVNTYSGDTTVSGGTLKLDNPNANNESSTVSIAASGAALELNFDELGGPVTDTVDKLFIGGVQQNAGVYKAMDNLTDAGTAISQITGPGTLTVSTGPITDPYDLWAAGKGLTVSNSAKDLDPDNDGRNNLAEFAFNGDPLSSSDNGKVYGLTDDSDYAGDPSSAKELILTVAVRTGTPVFAGTPSPSAILLADGITYTIEGSLNLGGFLTPINVAPTPVITGLPPAGAGYEYRSFSLDGSNGLAGKGFLRAKVTSP